MECDDYTPYNNTDMCVCEHLEEEHKLFGFFKPCLVCGGGGPDA